MTEVPTDVVAVKTDEVAKPVRHKEETNAFFHHLTNVTSKAAKLNEALQNDLLSQPVAINPIDSGREFRKDGASRPQDYVIDRSLLFGESSVDWEGDGHVRAVVMERVTLVCQHSLPIDQRLVVILVV